MAVCASTTQDEGRARELASDLQLALCATATLAQDCSEYAALLVVGAGTLNLQQTGRGAPGPVVVAFGSAAMRHRRRGGHNELLGKAIGLAKKPALRVLDATAGLGRDSFVLADLGASVSLCERNPIIANMLASGLTAAAASDDPWLGQVVQRMTLYADDARALADAELHEVDVIYLDPMFPERDKSAKVKKEMALFHALLGPDDDADELLLWSLRRDVARVVVKRPPRAVHLAGQKPSHSIAGKAVRYDVHVLRSLGR